MRNTKQVDLLKPLEKLFLEYINECKYSAHLRSETVRGYQAVFNLFLMIMPEVNDSTSLTTETLNEFFMRINTRLRRVGKKLKSGVKESTIKTQRSKLNAFFNWLIKKNYLEINPFLNIKSPRVRYDDFKRLENNEVNKIYSAITQHSNSPFLLRRDTVIISLLLHTGIRKGELISIRVSDVDLNKKLLTIRGETSKSRVTRKLPIPEVLVMHLKDYLQERKRMGSKSEYLIISRRGDTQLTMHGLKHWTEALEKKTGIDFHLHQFRHTFACKLVEADVSTFKIQKLMGHTDIRMTMKYTRSIQAEDLAEDIRKINYD